jgi:integrase
MPVTKANALTALKVRATNIPGDYSDGNGLTLRVEKTGTKRWVQRVSIGGKQRNIGLGGHPAVSLAAARDAAIANLQAIKTGRDVIAEKKEAREAARQPKLTVPTFAEEAAAVIAMRRPTWSNQKHADQWESTLATYAFPVLGQKPVDSVTTADVLTVLTPIWTDKPETASRVRQRMETVFDWVVANGHRLDNPAGKHILSVLPRVRKTKQHHRALPYAEVPAALERVRSSTADWVTRLAFEFLVLTASRSGEVRFAQWSEINRENATWHIPAERMKARRDHRVPLVPLTLELLEHAEGLSGGTDGGLIFPANRDDTVLSDMVFTVMLRRLEIPAVPHGFRRSFKSWATETKAASWYEGEAALAHSIGDNESAKAYVDTDLLEPRKEVMEKWAHFLLCPKLGD